MKLFIIVFLCIFLLSWCFWKKTWQEDEIYHNATWVESPSIDRNVGWQFFSDYYEQTDQLEIWTVTHWGPLD